MKENIEIWEIADYEDDMEEFSQELLEFIQQNDKDDKYGFLSTWNLEYIQDLFIVVESEVYIMTLDEKIIGLAKVGMFDTYVHIDDILISKKMRGKGYGKMMIEHAIQANEVFEADLYVDVTNTSAIIFYLKLGFIIKGYMSDYYGGKTDCIYMVKPKEE